MHVQAARFWSDCAWARGCRWGRGGDSRGSAAGVAAGGGRGAGGSGGGDGGGPALPLPHRLCRGLTSGFTPPRLRFPPCIFGPCALCLPPLLLLRSPSAVLCAMIVLTAHVAVMFRNLSSVRGEMLLLKSQLLHPGAAPCCGTASCEAGRLHGSWMRLHGAPLRYGGSGQDWHGIILSPGSGRY